MPGFRWGIRQSPLRPGSLLRSTLLVLAMVAGLSAASPARLNHPPHRHVTDADTVVVQNGQKVRLVQIDTPEVYFGTECRQASTTTKRLAGSVDRSLAP